MIEFNEINRLYIKDTNSSHEQEESETNLIWNGLRTTSILNLHYFQISI